MKHFIYVGSLNEQFVKHKCVVDYMVEFKDQQQCIFGNYIMMFSHVFEGLKYLHSQQIVHGDVKGYNFYCIDHLIKAYT